MRRTLAILAVAGLVVGGGAAAFAATTGSEGAPGGGPGVRDQVQGLSPDKKAALKDCVQKARADHTGDKPATREAVRSCFSAAGIDVSKLGHGLRAVRDQVKGLSPDKRAALKDCVKKARADHTGDKPATRDAVRSCLSAAGITLPTPP